MQAQAAAHKASWTAEDVARLATMWNDGLPAPAIATALRRTQDSIRSMACKAQLPYRRWTRTQDSRAGLRSCMCCERPFFSEGIHNRLCQPCVADAH